MDSLFKKKLISRINEGSPLKIFFLGLAKNTGKTTALNYVYAMLRQYTQRTIVLISTGYDGEDVDAITGLPKPRIKVFTQTIFVTTENLLNLIDPSCFVELKKFPWSTPFGKVMIAQALVDFEIPLVSPGSLKEIEQVLGVITNMFPTSIVLVDGSINRRAFVRLSISSDILVLSTGAAFSTQHEIQLQHMKFYHQVFTLPMIEKNLEGSFLEIVDDQNVLAFADQTIIIPDSSSVFLTPEGYMQFIKNQNKLCVQKLNAPIGLVTVNSFNPFGSPMDFSTLLPELHKIFDQTPVIDIFKLADAEA